MTYENRLPIGAIGNTSSEPPRYVPHAPAIYAPPLAEADTWPSVPHYPVNPDGFGSSAPRRVYLTPTPLPVRPAPQRHGWLYWRVQAARWWFVDLWAEMRLAGGWLGELAFLVILAALSAGVVVGSLLVSFWLMGR